MPTRGLLLRYSFGTVLFLNEKEVFMQIDCNRAKQAFLTYVKNYDASNPRVALKIEHSLRVADLCRTIAQNEHYQKNDCDLAWLIGLLHDIGRFEQLRRWNTFSDAQSTSHATLSVEVLFDVKDDENNSNKNNNDNNDVERTGKNANNAVLLRSFIDDTLEDNLIRKAVGLHSVFHLPDTLSNREHVFCSIVRDADKLDILEVMQRSTPEVIMNATLEDLKVSKLSAAVVEAFNQHRCVRREDRICPADFVVGFICFVFELEHPISKKLALESGAVLRLIDQPFGLKDGFFNPETQATFNHMKQEIEAYLS